MEEQEYLTFKLLCQEKRAKIFLAAILIISQLTNLVLAVSSCLKKVHETLIRVTVTQSRRGAKAGR